MGLADSFFFTPKKSVNFQGPWDDFVLYLMKQVAGGRLPGLNDIVIMPVAINTDVLCVLGEEIQGRTGGPLVLIFVFPTGLRTDALAGSNVAESRASTGHDVTLQPENSPASSRRLLAYAYAIHAKAVKWKHFDAITFAVLRFMQS